MNCLDVILADSTLQPAPTRVGHLFRVTERRGDMLRFEYDTEWLKHADAFALEPRLPLHPGPFYADDPAQLAEIFQDCAPDRWGKMLMDRREAMDAREHNRPRRILRAWDYLTGVDDGVRMGALRLAVPDTSDYLSTSRPSAPPLTSLRELEAAAKLVEQGADGQVDKHIRQLIAPGGSLGGARPKASFIDENGELWLAKFPSTEDRHDVGLWEFLTHQLSQACGIAMPPARLLALSSRGHTFAVKRFDRHYSAAGEQRRLYASAKTLLATLSGTLPDMESYAASYLDLVMAIENYGAAGRINTDLEQLFRRAVFNVLIGNRDDHLRNHGFLRETTGWTLSPAFDVNPNLDKDVHVLALDDSDPTPDSRVLLAQHAFFRLKEDRAVAIVEDIRNAVRQWEKRARKLGAKRTEVSLLGAVIDPER